MEIKTIGDATLWYTQHGKTLDDFGKLAMKTLWDSRETDEEKIDLAQSVQAAVQEIGEFTSLMDKAKRIVEVEQAHKFVQLLSIEDPPMQELIALDATGRTWYWINTGTEWDLTKGHWQQMNPERVPYGLRKKQ